mgnify:FL=1
MSKENNYLFDVDGTLTPSRGVIDPEFKKWFLNFCSKNNVILVTGSDRPKTIEQLGREVYNACQRVYNCSGNDVYEGKKKVKFNDWNLPLLAQRWLKIRLDNSPYELRTGKHIENRTGMINFSVVGRNATAEERKDYHEYDEKFNERLSIAQDFEKEFTELQAKVGGETGIDIFPKGCDKGQVVKDFKKSTINFYGDRCDPQGNDYPIARLLKPKQVNHVKDWRDCWELLRNV